jgi:hypothetical protein
MDRSHVIRRRRSVRTLCAASALIVVVASGACTRDDDSAPTSAPGFDVGDIAVGRDGCEYRFLGDGRWTAADWCVDVARRGVGDVYPFGEPDHAVATVDVSTPSQLLAFPYGIDLWMRIPTSAGQQPQVLYLERWMPASEYTALLARQAAGADLEAARDVARRALKSFMRLADDEGLQRLLDAAAIFREPPCPWSGDRCVAATD